MLRAVSLYGMRQPEVDTFTMPYAGGTGARGGRGSFSCRWRSRAEGASRWYWYTACRTACTYPSRASVMALRMTSDAAASTGDASASRMARRVMSRCHSIGSAAVSGWRARCVR